MPLTPEEKRQRQLKAKRRYNAKNREKRAEYRRKWRAENPDKRYEETNRHREKHPEKRKEWDAQYRERNRKELVEKSKKYIQANGYPAVSEARKEKHREISRNYMRQPKVRARNNLREKFGINPPSELLDVKMILLEIKRELRKNPHEEC